VAHDVQLTISTDNVFNECTAIIFVANVRLKKLRLAAVVVDLLNYRITIVFGAGSTDHGRALVSKYSGDAFSDATACTGDHCDLACNRYTHVNQLL
jgi:hypothetical protein